MGDAGNYQEYIGALDERTMRLCNIILEAMTQYLLNEAAIVNYNEQNEEETVADEEETVLISDDEDEENEIIFVSETIIVPDNEE